MLKEGIAGTAQPRIHLVSPSLVGDWHELYRQRATPFIFSSSSLLALAVLELIAAFPGLSSLACCTFRRLMGREEILVPYEKLTCGPGFRTSKPEFTTYMHLYFFKMLWLYMILGFKTERLSPILHFLKVSSWKCPEISPTLILAFTRLIDDIACFFSKKEALQQKECL
jgi:hypothetical protein